MRRIIVISSCLVLVAGLFAGQARSQQKRPSRVKTGFMGRLLGLKTIPNPDVLMKDMQVPSAEGAKTRRSSVFPVKPVEPPAKTFFDRPVVIMPKVSGESVPRITPGTTGRAVPRPKPVITGTTAKTPTIEPMADWDTDSWPESDETAVNFTQPAPAEPTFRYVPEGPMSRPLGEVFVQRPTYRMPNPFSAELDSVLNSSGPVACGPKIVEPVVATTKEPVESAEPEPKPEEPESEIVAESQVPDEIDAPPTAQRLMIPRQEEPPELDETEVIRTEDISLSVPDPLGEPEEPLSLIDAEQEPALAVPTPEPVEPVVVTAPKPAAPKPLVVAEKPRFVFSEPKAPTPENTLRGADQIITFTDNDADLGREVAPDKVQADRFAATPEELSDAPLFNPPQPLVARAPKPASETPQVKIPTDDDFDLLQEPEGLTSPKTRVASTEMPVVRPSTEEQPGKLPVISPAGTSVASVAAALGRTPSTRPQQSEVAAVPPREALPRPDYRPITTVPVETKLTDQPAVPPRLVRTRPDQASDEFMMPSRPGFVQPRVKLETPEPMQRVTAADIRANNWKKRRETDEIPLRSVARERVIAGMTGQIRQVSQPTTKTVATPKVTRPMSRLERKRAIESRKDLLGLKGFCPVELRNNRRLVDSSQAISAMHGTRTYYFSSEAAKRQFLEEPIRYVPAADGADVVLLARMGEQLQGRLDYATWYRHRLFLFTSETSMNAFNSNPKLYVRRK